MVKLSSWSSKVTLEQRAAGCFAVKRYDRADTAAFKCWGSGVRNEQVARGLLGAVVPRTLRCWEDADAEYAALEWVDAPTIGATRAEDEQLRAAGRLLGRIHGLWGQHIGALDSSHVFESHRAAFTSRFQASVRLLRPLEPELADEVERWSAPRLAALRVEAPPSLVHGDFGPANLLARDDRLWIIDWEHARWGCPQEDWAKILLALRFPEPNGFHGRPRAVRLLQEAWTSEAGRELPCDPLFAQLLEVYFAVCLGVFFDQKPNPRLDWVERIVRRGGSATGASC